MRNSGQIDRTENAPEIRPWYREPWPWVAIAIPTAAVIMGAITLYLALSNPDYLVVDDHKYQEIRAGLQAQPVVAKEPDEQVSPQSRDDGDR